MTREDRELAWRVWRGDDTPENQHWAEQMAPWLDGVAASEFPWRLRGLADGLERIAAAISAVRENERECVLAMARAHEYGPTLRTFAKWVSRGRHREKPAAT